MNTRFFAVALLACSLLFVCTFNACKPKSGSSDTLDTTQAGGQGNVVESSTAVSAIYLDSLVISVSAVAAAIDTTKKQTIVFNYFVGDTAVTMHGWVLLKRSAGSGNAAKDTGVFNPTPDLVLQPIGKTAVAIGPRTYLSNQVMLGRDLRKLIKALATRKGYLHFKPVKDATGRISYAINFKKTTSRGEMYDVLVSGFTTNPSPPHQAFD
ncbi:hypothetical protein [Fibrella arboris]|uniref:hypothetical protein n=1 Tax=Fibrella arboris TaxID=3242486 RepID=UPI00351FC8B2